VPPGKAVDVHIRPAREAAVVFEREGGTLGRLARATVSIINGAPVTAAAHAVIAGGTEIIVPLAGLIDVEAECAKLRTEAAELEKQITARRGRLENPKYVERAPAQVVANDRAILEEMVQKREQLVEKVRALCGG